jgi:hypothetical protein
MIASLKYAGQSDKPPAALGWGDKAPISQRVLQ